MGYVQKYIVMALWLMVAVNIDVKAMNPIHHAALNGDVEQLQLLVADGAQVNSDYEGEQPIHIAAEKGHTGVIALLLEHQAHVNNITVYEGWTPLHKASMNGHTETVQFLLAQGARYDVQDGDRYMPVYWAALSAHHQTLHFLLKHEMEQQAVLPAYAQECDCVSTVYKKTGLPIVVISLVFDYKGLEQDCFEVDDFVFIDTIMGTYARAPSMSMENRLEQSPLQCAHIHMAQEKNEAKKADYEKCIHLLEAQPRLIMRKIVTSVCCMSHN